MRSFSKLVKTTVLSLALVALTVPTRAADLDKLAPGNAEAALIVNIKNFLDSALFKKYGEAGFDAALKDERAAEFIKATGLDPRKDITSVTLAAPLVLTPNDAKAVVIIKGNFNVAKLQAAIEAGAKKQGKELEIKKDGGLTYYTMPLPQGNQEVTGTVVGNDAILVSNNMDYLKTIATGKKIETTVAAKTLKGAIGGVGAKETLILGVAVTDELKKRLADNPATKQYADKVEALTATINIGESIDLSVGLTTTDADTAKALGQLVKQALPLLNLLAAQNENAKPAVDLLMKNLKVSSEGKAVSLKLQLTEEALRKLQPGGN